MATKVAKIWDSGKAVVNGWLAIPSGFSAEVMAQCGFDAVTVDMQHGVQDYQSMVQCFQAMQAHPVTPMVRVPWNEPGIIGKVLDAGAMGVICPMINDAAECAAFVQACRYPPDGYRSSGPTRAAIYGGADYHAKANGEMLTFAMIETAAGLANVEAIVATPGLDGVYIGPSDLSLAMGGPPGQDSQAPSLLAAFDTILAACKARGVRVGVHTNSVAYSQQMIARGFDLVTVGSDTRYLGSGRREAADMRSWVDGR